MTSHLISALAPGNRDLVGWGTGAVFDYFFDVAPLPLRFLVDNDPSRQGTRREGIQVVAPGTSCARIRRGS